MALEVQVYKDITAYEPKIMFSMSWRQLAAATMTVILGGGIYASVAIGLHASGGSWDDATSTAMYVMFPVIIPFAAWGWWRPKGLKPERYIGYLIHHVTARKVITYEDEYRGMDAGRPTDQRSQAERKAGRKREKTNLEER